MAKTANVNKQKAKLNKEIKRGRAARQIAANTPLGGLPGRSGSRARHLVRAEVDRSPARGKPQTDDPMINVLPLNLDDRPKPRVHHGKPSRKHAAALKAAYAQLGKPYPYD